MSAYRITLRRLVAEVTKLSFDDNLSQKALKTAEELYESNLKYAKQHTWRRLLHAKHLNEVRCASTSRRELVPLSLSLS